MTVDIPESLQHQRKKARVPAFIWLPNQLADNLSHIEFEARNPNLAELVGRILELPRDNRSLVESVSEWPFTTSNYARFLLYLLIPAFSWGLGMVAEEFVSRSLL